MTTKYVLPCACGEKLVVSNRQAGESIRCSCGNELEVPTMRGLARLARLDADQIGPTVSRPWGPRQGLFFIGLLIAALAFGYCGYLFFFGPAVDLEKIRSQVESLPPAETWFWWQHLDHWTPGMPIAHRLASEYEIFKARQAMQIAAGIGICSLLVAASGLLVRSRR